ncbi:MAG: RNA 2',3'-cyclic phosphodiesterase [Acidimicrobiia bacterium]
MVESVGRVFVAVAPPAEVRAAVTTHVSALALPTPSVPPQNLHITLRFLGSIDGVSFDRLVAGLDEAVLPAPFRLEVGSLGAFPSPRNATVAWLAVEDGSGALHRLWEAVDDVCVQVGFGREERPFRPHLTVARLRPPQDLRTLIASAPPFSARFRVDALTVFRSDAGPGAPRYHPLERFPLAGGSR